MTANPDAEAQARWVEQESIVEAINDLETASPDKAAALLLIGLSHTSNPCQSALPKDECKYETGFAFEALAALRALLSGQIAHDVAELLDNPEKPYGELTWFGG